MKRLLVRHRGFARGTTSAALRGAELVVSGDAAARTSRSRESIDLDGRSTSGAKAPAPVNDGDVPALAGAWSADRGSLELLRAPGGASGLLLVTAGVPPGGAMNGGGIPGFASADSAADVTRRRRSETELRREATLLELACDRATHVRAFRPATRVTTRPSTGAYRPDRSRLVAAGRSVDLAVGGSDRARSRDRASSRTSRFFPAQWDPKLGIHVT